MSQTFKANWLVYAVAAALLIQLFNAYMITGIGARTSVTSAASATPWGTVDLAGVFDDMRPKGVPVVYGAELGVSYDDISVSNPSSSDAAIRKLAAKESIQLSGEQLKRYIGITSQISCEYCCGAPSIIDSRGEPACSCAHSSAMRGLGKYLVSEHPELSDDTILSELAKWKTLFFPQNMAKKAVVLSQQLGTVTFSDLGSNKYRGAEYNADVGSDSSGMAGACG
ncbi:hypothetical protein HYS54_02680 [Candidatus Micrarchaeota archaeon]|nr:hypothetical protein [Candidatus Micrarchaeota archaeon]